MKVKFRTDVIFDNPKSRRDFGKIATIENMLEKLNETRCPTVSKIRVVGRIFHIVRIVPVAQ